MPLMHNGLGYNNLINIYMLIEQLLFPKPGGEFTPLYRTTSQRMRRPVSERYRPLLVPPGYRQRENAVQAPLPPASASSLSGPRDRSCRFRAAASA